MTLLLACYLEINVRFDIINLLLMGVAYVNLKHGTFSGALKYFGRNTF